MATLLFVVATLSLFVVHANAANLTVGSCVTIELKNQPDRQLYDSGKSGKYWVYISKNAKSANITRTHHWKVKSKQDGIIKFENVQHPNQCLCERKGMILLIMYAATCACEENATAQKWKLQGENDAVKIIRPNDEKYFLSECFGTGCAFISQNPKEWVLKPCRTD
jgi:hypothetical protein